MTDPARPVLHCALVSRRGRQHRNDDAVSLGGWALQADRGEVLELTLHGDEAGPIRLAVTDGMGGRPAGATAARVASEALTRAASPSDATDDDGLRRLFEAADDAVRAAATDATAGLGCTAAYLEIAADGTAVIANIGDVRVYQSLNGYLAVLTRDDRPPNGAGRVTRCLGGSRRDDVTPHRFALRLRPGDALFVMTDGAYDLLDDAQLEAALHRSLRTTVERIMATILSKEPRDDVTVLAVELLGPAG